MFKNLMSYILAFWLSIGVFFIETGYMMANLLIRKKDK